MSPSAPLQLVDGYTFLYSGHPLPGNQERATRKEGVGMDEKAIMAWKDAGEV